MNLPSELEPQITSLLDAARFIAERRWCPATGGNFSLRIDRGEILITASGRDKQDLQAEDLLLIDECGGLLAGQGRPSAETAVHAALYALDAGINAVLHTHSIASTVLSRCCPEDWLVLSGYEMQKAVSGCSSHDGELALRIFANSQDMPALASEIAAQWHQRPLSGGLLLRGHGLYAWGRDLDEARRHLEGLEFLLHSELECRRLGGQP